MSDKFDLIVSETLEKIQRSTTIVPIGNIRQFDNNSLNSVHLESPSGHCGIESVNSSENRFPQDIFIDSLFDEIRSNHKCDLSKDAFTEFICMDQRVRVECPFLHRKTDIIAFQNSMTESFKKIAEIIKDDGILSVMYELFGEDIQSLVLILRSLFQADFKILASRPLKDRKSEQQNVNKIIILAKKMGATETKPIIITNKTQDEILKYVMNGASMLESEGYEVSEQLVAAVGTVFSIFSKHSCWKYSDGSLLNINNFISDIISKIKKSLYS